MKWKHIKRASKIATVAFLFTTLAIIWLPGFAGPGSAETRNVRSQKKEVKHNRLIHESSPYLLQHATNPVDWYPWGEEAFEKAKKENKPIFLSIGYSTCHWCHVMEHESFADEEVAALLNKDFVAVKVDREERPDIDQVYMAVTQAMTGRGGWPNNVFLTPDKKPFFAGTYFPKQARWGLPGLMIAALAKAGRVLDDSRYASAAVKAADFIMRQLRDKNGRLMKRYRAGNAGLPAHLNDYAFVVWGFLELYQTTFKSIYLKEAIRLNDLMIEHYWDNQNGGLFMTADDAEKLLIRNKEIYDGAIPSGNSVAALNLLRLGHITARQDYLQKAESIGKAFSASVNRYPSGHANLMVALEYALHPNYEVVIAGKPQAKDTQAMLTALRKPFLPGKVVVVRPADKKEAAAIIRLAPYTEFMVPKDGKATAYVCTDFVCKLPTTEISQMLANLQTDKKK